MDDSVRSYSEIFSYVWIQYRIRYLPIAPPLCFQPLYYPNIMIEHNFVFFPYIHNLSKFYFYKYFE